MSNLKDDKIVSIEFIGYDDTIDIAVSGDNLFLANDILTHNSGYSVAAPGLTTLSESYALGATADFIASAWKGEGDEGINILRFSLLKNRFGRNTGTYISKIDYSTLTITEFEDEMSLTDESAESARALAAFGLS